MADPIAPAETEAAEAAQAEVDPAEAEAEAFAAAKAAEAEVAEAEAEAFVAAQAAEAAEADLAEAVKAAEAAEAEAVEAEADLAEAEAEAFEAAKAAEAVQTEVSEAEAELAKAEAEASEAVKVAKAAEAEAAEAEAEAFVAAKTVEMLLPVKYSSMDLQEMLRSSKLTYFRQGWRLFCELFFMWKFWEINLLLRFDCEDQRRSQTSIHGIFLQWRFPHPWYVHTSNYSKKWIIHAFKLIPLLQSQNQNFPNILIASIHAKFLDKTLAKNIRQGKRT